MKPEPNHAITILGEDVPCGTYILRVTIDVPISVRFGKFNGGEPLAVPAGTLAYVGSAMGVRGASSLARRVMRHASRSFSHPHRLRPALAAAFAEKGMAAGDIIPQKKTLRWHVDYLLENPAAEIDRVLILRSTRRLESAVATRLAVMDDVSPVAAGLGASDARGETHLFFVPVEVGWWQRMVGVVEKL